MDKKNSLKKRLSYWFDNKMAAGFGPKVRMLLLITIIFIVLVGTLAAIAHGGIHENFFQDFIRTFMYTLGKGGALNPDDAHISVIYFILMLLTIIYCIFFSAMLIGLINNALRSKVEDLGKGYSRVVENNHILILGFNDATFVLLSELIKANENRKKTQTIVILGDIDQKSMLEQIQKKLDWPNRRSKTNIIGRTGSIYNFEDLKRCSIETCHSVIINAPNDFESVKAIMACSFIINQSELTAGRQPFFISIIQNEENLIEAKLAAKDNAADSLIILALNEVLARIMVHTSRQPGLSDVFTELFNFDNSEFYIFDSDPTFAQLQGKTIAEINQLLTSCFVVGVKKSDAGIVIDSPLNTMFENGDSLIVIADDDNPLKIASIPHNTVKVPAVSPEQSDRINVLIIGVEPVLESILREYSCYLQAGSSIHIVDHRNRLQSVISEEAQQMLHDSNIAFNISSFDPSQKNLINALLEQYSPDCVLVLADEDTATPDAEDEFILRTLIYLREYRSRSNHYFSITCEMLKANNKELAAATEPDDFIISRQFSALMMSQISQNKELASLFEILLSNYGFEIYTKPAYWYIPMNEPIDLFNISKLVAEKNEIFIGVRQKKNGRYQIAKINPIKVNSQTGKAEEYIFGEEDYLVVLSASSHFPE